MPSWSGGLIDGYVWEQMRPREVHQNDDDLMGRVNMEALENSFMILFSHE